MMVLSASSVNAYVNSETPTTTSSARWSSSVVGVIGAVVITRLPHRGAPGARLVRRRALAAVLLILTYTPLGIKRNGNRNWLDLGSSLFSIQPPSSPSWP